MTLCACGLDINPLQIPVHLGGKRHSRGLLRRGTGVTSAVPVPATTSRAADVPLASRTSGYDGTNSREPPSSNSTDALPARPPVSLIPAADEQTHTGTDIHCHLCDKDVFRDMWTLHLASDAHLRNQSQASVHSMLQTAENNRNDIEVAFQNGIDFGVVDLQHAAGLSSTRLFEVAVKCTKATTEVWLSDMRFSSSGRGAGASRCSFRYSTYDHSLMFVRLGSL